MNVQVLTKEDIQLFKQEIIKEIQQLCISNVPVKRSG
jgi:hypothetical protein